MKNTGRIRNYGLFQSRQEKNIFKTFQVFLLLNVLLISSLLVKSTNEQYLPGFPPPGYNTGYQQPGGNGVSGMGMSLGLGHRDYGDECQNQPSILFNADDSKLCDASRGLYCGYIGRCLCYVPGSIYRNGKCRARVGRSCQGGDASTIECVVNAECSTSTRFCNCRRNYWSNDEGTACNHGHKLATVTSPTILLSFFGFLTAFQLYRHH